MLDPTTETKCGNFGSIPPTDTMLGPTPLHCVGPAWDHGFEMLNSPLLFIRWGASQVQFSFAAMSQFDWPNTPKNETVDAPDIEGSNMKYRDPPLWPPYIPKGGQHLPQHVGWKWGAWTTPAPPKIKEKGLHAKSTVHCPSGKWTVNSPLSKPNTTWKKKPSLPPTHKKKKGSPSPFTPRRAFSLVARNFYF